MLWPEFRAYRGLRGGRCKCWLVMLGGNPVHMFTEVVIQPRENAVFENAQIEVPGWAGRNID